MLLKIADIEALPESVHFRCLVLSCLDGDSPSDLTSLVRFRSRLLNTLSYHTSAN